MQPFKMKKMQINIKLEKFTEKDFNHYFELVNDEK